MFNSASNSKGAEEVEVYRGRWKKGKGKVKAKSPKGQVYRLGRVKRDSKQMRVNTQILWVRNGQGCEDLQGEKGKKNLKNCEV